MKLLAFTGRMGSGKSTAIDCLKDLQHNPVILRKFAAPLYDIQEMIYRRINKVYDKPQNFTKDRFLLQFLGTEWGRQKISDTIWVDIWKKETEALMRAANMLENEPIIVCDDVRYDNEAEAIKALGGHIIQLVSFKVDERINTKSGIVNHTSENGIDIKYIDYIIQNDDTIEDLRGSLCELNKRLHIW